MFVSAQETTEMAVYQVCFVHVLANLTQRALIWRQSLFYTSEKRTSLNVT